MEGYITIKCKSEFEYEDRRSVFIGAAAPVESEKEALDFIEMNKRKYPDARHHVYAYVLRENSIMRFSDDHEPQGTAGMPVLDVIRKNGCTDTVIVVTRYFGGTLLGTGGLVRAYTAAAVGALNSAQIIKYDVYATASIEVSYSDYQKIGTHFGSSGFRTEDVDYSDSVKVRGSIELEKYSSFEYQLIQLTGGRVKVNKICEKFDF